MISISSLTESEIDNDMMRAKVRRDVTVGVDEIGKRCAECAGIGGTGAVLNSGRHTARVTGPEPDVDVCRRALHGVPAATVCVEGGAV